MLKVSTLKENLLAFIIALLLSIIVIFAINQSKILQADILNTDENSNESVNLDLGNVSYYYDGTMLIVESEQNFQNVSTLSLVVSYDSEKFSFEYDSIDSKYDYTFGDTNEGRINIIIDNIDNIVKGDKILTIETNSNESLLNFSNVQIKFTDGTIENLSLTRK